MYLRSQKYTCEEGEEAITYAVTKGFKCTNDTHYLKTTLRLTLFKEFPHVSKLPKERGDSYCTYYDFKYELPYEFLS